MTHKNRLGLTLIEVVVLLLLVLMLLALLLPAINNDGSRRRRSDCTNNQKQLAMALLNYEARNGKFPGYANRISSVQGKNRVATSWIVPVLPYLDRQDLFEKWKEGVLTAPHMPVLVCPNDQHRTGDTLHPWLSFVVNCGLPGDKDDTPATGVFHNHNVDAKPVTISLDYTSQHDGATNTLLLSENLQSGLWTDTEEADVGMVWWREPAECSRINRCTDVGRRPQDIKYARPSSPHGGVLIVSFCDGHQKQLLDTIDYKVYQQLMAPDDNAAGLPDDFDPEVLERP
jgi:prepilin-type processing-associated H-X9-DG protein